MKSTASKPAVATQEPVPSSSPSNKNQRVRGGSREALHTPQADGASVDRLFAEVTTLHIVG